MAGIAFYAPLKSSRHPVPSGDRQMARAVLAALAGGPFGWPVQEVSDLRLFDGRGCDATQAALRQQAAAEVERLIGARQDWRLWVTYHNYYKAPDLMGPRVAAHLGIPYVQIESTRSVKRLHGPWAGFARAAHDAIAAADAVFWLTERDFPALKAAQREGQKLVRLAPFLALGTLPNAMVCPRAPVILAVGMMRPGDKLASYRRIADVLPHLTTPDWQLHIAGDGPCRAEIETIFAPWRARVRFLGAVTPDAMAKTYRAARLLLWPGVNEAFGVTYLEAQAEGLPALAEDRPGVRDVMPAGALCPEGAAAQMAARVDALLHEDAVWHRAQAAGRDRVATRHLLGAARGSLWPVLSRLVGAVV